MAQIAQKRGYEKKLERLLFTGAKCGFNLYDGNGRGAIIDQKGKSFVMACQPKVYDCVSNLKA